MCTTTCIEFGKKNLKSEMIHGKSVLEVGAQNINGSLRPFIESLDPDSYLGTDIQAGPGVDLVLPAENLLAYFGQKRFDLVISTEILEHAEKWRDVISNMKQILKPEGILLVTTRSKGFPFHSYSYDFWRYEISDIKEIFSDFEIGVLETDSDSPGVFMIAKKPLNFIEKNLDTYALYSIIRKKRILNINNFDIFLFKIRYPIERLASRILPHSIKNLIKSYMN